MIDWLWRRTDAVATWWSFAALLALVIVFFVLFGRYGAHYPEKSFDGHRFGVGTADIQRILASFDKAKQLGQYLAQETQLDLVFPAIYGLCFAVLIVLLQPRGWRWLIVVPYATAFFDYCENVCFIALVLHYRAHHDVSPALAAVASIASRLKWTFMLLLLPAVVIAAVRHFR
jgi:hypothetical protein